MKILSNLNEDGLTLVEVLASVVILSIVILTSLTFFSQALFFSAKEEDNLTGVNIAEKILFDVVENPQLIEHIKENEYWCGETPLNVGIELSSIITNVPYDSEKRLFYYVINDRKYYSEIFICHTEEENNLELYRSHIKIYLEEGTNPRAKLVYDTFQYINLY